MASIKHPRLPDSIIINRMCLPFERTEFEIITLQSPSPSPCPPSISRSFSLAPVTSPKRYHTLPAQGYSLITKTSRIVVLLKSLTRNVRAFVNFHAVSIIGGVKPVSMWRTRVTLLAWWMERFMYMDWFGDFAGITNVLLWGGRVTLCWPLVRKFLIILCRRCDTE